VTILGFRSSPSVIEFSIIDAFVLDIAPASVYVGHELRRGISSGFQCLVGGVLLLLVGTKSWAACYVQPPLDNWGNRLQMHYPSGQTRKWLDQHG